MADLRLGVDDFAAADRASIEFKVIGDGRELWTSGLLKGGKRGPAIIPGDPDKSLLIQAMAHTHAELKMPKGGDPLNAATVEAFLAMPLPLPDLQQARIVTGDCFVECPDHSLRLREGLGGDLVDMETGALAQVAVRLGLPWAAIKATTDNADGSSSGDFQSNLKRGAKRAAEAAERMISLIGG